MLFRIWQRRQIFLRRRTVHVPRQRLLNHDALCLASRFGEFAHSLKNLRVNRLPKLRCASRPFRFFLCHNHIIADFRKISR